MRFKALWIRTSLVFVSWLPSVSTLAWADDDAPAKQENIGVVLKAGTAANVDLTCYDARGQGVINGLVAEGTECCRSLDDAAKISENGESWHQNRWMWFSIGLVIGGAGVGYVSTR